ncbi:MAG: aldo/keto reductase [Clostridia bacterium]|nr:aldo/keto reductase [Clostridia bacterium]
MQYRINPKNNDRLSALGFGCMRFSRKGGSIDYAKAEQELIHAIDGGINYLDTAYIYPGSETFLGKFLSKGYREKIKLATKLPLMMIKKQQDIEAKFSEQKSRLKTDRIDYFLMHMLTSMKQWERLKGLGIEDWIAEKKRLGEIVNIGFSYHGGTGEFKRIIDDYDWDFCYIQYNYMDERSQAGVEGLRYAAQKGIPVMIMEPLRGGTLASKLPGEAVKRFEREQSEFTPAQWGLRWLFDQPEPTVVLSGMNSTEMIDQNISVADSSPVGCMDEAEHRLINEVRDIIKSAMRISCTGCSYCMPCPQGVDIPVCFSSYNILHTEGWFKGMKTYFMCTSMRRDPSIASNCIGCGKCERHCPQGIQIREELKKVTKELETPVYKIAKGLSKRFVKF